MKWFLNKNKIWFHGIIWVLGILVVNVMVSTAGPDYKLPACPSSPNCVSSQSADDHFIKPFPITGEAKISFDRLKAILGRRNDTSIVSADDRLIRVEFRTALGFVDDGFFVLDAEGKVIHIFSASRMGYWDFDKNRRRMEEIRQEYQ